MTKTGPGLIPGGDGKRFVMANNRPNNPGLRAKSEPTEAAAERPSKSRIKARAESEAVRPPPQAEPPQAPAAKTATPRREPAKPMPATAAPAARETPAPRQAPAPRRAQRRQATEIQTAAAPQETAQSTAPAPRRQLNPPLRAAAAREDRQAAGRRRPRACGASGQLVRRVRAGAQYPAPDVETLAHNIAQAIEQGGKVMAAYLRPRESGEIKTTIADEVAEMVKSIGRVAEYYLSDPQRALAAQTALATQFVNLWASTLQRLQGERAAPVAAPDPSDKRFADAEWRNNPYFDFIKQAYVLTTRWADDLVRRADELEPHDRDKAQFYLRQVTAALSPSNFLATNPELLRTTLAESGENLVRGLKMLAEDIQAGHGNLRIRQSDARAFKLGVNLATTPGKVIFRNALIELIQYEPTTPEVFKRPLLIVPPWINKFYILDLNPEKSFIRWAVAQGLTVFVISWVNPDERHADKDFDAYMHEGILTALDCVEQATGEREVTAIGYCVGGTLLAATLGYMAAVGDKRINSVTFFTALVDFTDAGDLKVFVDAEQLKAVEERMAEQGYLEGSEMAARLQHAAAERPHLVLLRQQLSQGQRADALRPPGLEFGLDAHARRQPQVLSAPLLSPERSFQRAHGAERQDARPQESDDPDLRAGVARGPHRPGPRSVQRSQMLRRSGALRIGRLRPYRGRRQPRRQAEISVLDGWAAGGRVRRPGSPRPRRRRAPGGPTGSNGSPPRRRRKSPPASRATASSNRSPTRRGSTCG